MGIADWFRKIIGGREDDEAADNGEAAADEAEAEFAGLNFKTAIDAHMKWKLRLEAVIDGRSEEALDCSVVCRDDRCTLGQWLHGPGKARFGGGVVFRELVQRHANFHRDAGLVLSLAQAGDREQAARLLRGGYHMNSQRVKMLLAKLYLDHQES